MTSEKEVLLHIGFPKTGTKTIQKFCHVNREILARHGTLFPKFDDSLTRGLPGVHIPFAAAIMRRKPPHLSGLDSATLEQSFESLFADFKKSDFQKLIISNETLSQHGDLDFPKLMTAAAGHKVTIIAYIRRYDEWIESYYRWYLTHGINQKIQNFEDYPPRKEMEQNTFSKKLTELKAKLPGSTFAVRSYDTVKDQLMHDFLEICELSESAELHHAISALSRENVGMTSGDSLFLAQVVSRIGNGSVSRKVAATIGKKAKAGEPSPLSKLPGAFFDVESRAKAREIFNADSKILAKEFGLPAAHTPPPTLRDAQRITALSCEQMNDMIEFVAGEFTPDELTELRRAVAC